MNMEKLWVLVGEHGYSIRDPYRTLEAAEQDLAWVPGAAKTVEAQLVMHREPMVPLRLVEEIAKAWDETASCTDSCMISNVPAAIRAAREGAG